MNIPEKIPYSGGSYRPFSHIGTSGIARVYRSLHVPKAAIRLKKDYPMNAHRILKILPQIQVNEEEFTVLVGDERNFDYTHRNLIKVERSLIHDDADFVIAMEDMSGSIHDLLKSRRNFLGNGMPEKMVCFILKEVLEGLSYMHSQGQEHNSLDTWSIFYDTKKSPAIKLNSWAANFDIGVLRKADRRITGNRRITKRVQCPERRGVNPEHAYTSMSDVWHLGLTAIEMSLGELNKQNNGRADFLINAFRAAHQRPICLNMIASSSKFPNMQVRGRLMKKSMSVTILDHHFSPMFVDFVVKCTHNLPQERPEARALLNHPFFETYLSNEAEFQRSLIEALTF